MWRMITCIQTPVLVGAVKVTSKVQELLSKGQTQCGLL